MAIFEVNPLALNVPSNAPIKSISLATNLDWFDTSSSPLTGENVILNVSSKNTIAANKVFATGSSIGVPSMRSLTQAHIPNIEISQVNGLQSALNSLIKTLVSANQTALAVTNNGVGDYTLTPNFGAVINTFAQGNDTRFPANVTGLRKGAGAGSLDVAATARTDYWDTTVFVASGGSHAKGLVPDPGAVGGVTKFLREDATWVVPAGTGTVTNIATTSPISGGPITTTGTLSLLVNVDFAWTAAQSIKLSNATTNAVDPLFTIGHNSSGTAANGFGGRIKYTLEDNTTNDQDAAYIDAAWSDATHASHASYVDICASTGGTNPTTKLRVWGSGGLSVNNVANPGAGVVSATGFKNSAVISSLLKADGSGQFIAAVAKTDYWDTTDFVGIGPSNAHGLVPAPGNPGGSPTRYLREDASWQVFTPAAGSITPAMLFPISARNIFGNPTGSSASPVAISPFTARSSLVLNIESITTFGDANYTGLSTDRYISTSATFTASRTVTLPLASTFNPSQIITISDDFGAINGAFTMIIARQGSDTIQGSTSSLVMDVPKGGWVLSSDGTSKWFVKARIPSVKRQLYVSDGTYTTPVGVKALLIECVGAGGGGAGATAAGAQTSVGAGGGGGGYAVKLITNPTSSYSYVIGLGGAQGAAANGTGGNGGDTNFSSGVCKGGGGTGGTNSAGSGTSAILTGTGGTTLSSSGDQIYEGGSGGHGLRLSGTAGYAGFGGNAGGTGGGVASIAVITELGGKTGKYPGGGGSGALSTSTNAFTGGAGGAGIMVITEYY